MNHQPAPIDLAKAHGGARLRIVLCTVSIPRTQAVHAEAIGQVATHLEVQFDEVEIRTAATDLEEPVKMRA